MNILDLNGLNVSGATPINATKSPQSKQDSSISTYATRFFKDLNSRAGSFVRGLTGRVTDFFKDLRGKFEADPTVIALTTYFKGLLNTPLSKEDTTDTLETRLASLGEFINDEALKANRALANLFYRTRAELLNRILAENKTEILATTFAASDGLAAADEAEPVAFLDIVGTKQAIETPEKIIANDIEQLKARTTAQKVWDFVCNLTFGSNAKKSISLHQKNQAKLEQNHRDQILKKHAEIMAAFDKCKNLESDQLEPTLEDLKTKIIELDYSIDEFALLCKNTKKADLLKEACKKELNTKISNLNFYTFAANQKWECSKKLTRFHKKLNTIEESDGLNTPPLTDSEGRSSPLLSSPSNSPRIATWKIYDGED